jgi:hypothetical protein
MPLNHSPSDEARSENIATERRAGKPEAQAVAIGYSEQRRAEGGKSLADSLNEDAKSMYENLTKKE